MKQLYLTSIYECIKDWNTGLSKYAKKGQDNECYWKGVVHKLAVVESIEMKEELARRII